MLEVLNLQKDINMEEKTVEVNGQTLTESQLQEKKEEISKQKGIVLVEVSPGVFKTRLND